MARGAVDNAAKYRKPKSADHPSPPHGAATVDPHELDIKFFRT
ncbi:hypothetical protein [Secundilactobacillus collinoides]|nr:hypothetical protein [Secundilactobacillus collinoides]